MGGDHAPQVVVEGAKLASERLSDAHFIFFGDKKKIEQLCIINKFCEDRFSIRHFPEAIGPHDKPSIALRQGKMSSMNQAIHAVASKEAHCVVSAGNTGVLMALTMFGLKRLETVSRPAILAMFPNAHSMMCMLDLGANIEADATNLCQFGVMGECFARAVLGIEKPKIGILNVGEEDTKGYDALRDAANILRNKELGLNFVGFIEGDDIGKGTVDVVVTDGFTGNIALKTMEGTVKLLTSILRDSFNKSWFFGSLAKLFLYPIMKRFKNTTDPRLYNGAVFLGLNGISLKSHGGTDSVGFANAVEVAFNLVKVDFINQVQAGLLKLNQVNKSNNTSV